MDERLIILSESEIRTALRTFLDCSVKELEDNIVESLLLYSPPGRINKRDTKVASATVTVKKKSDIPIDFICDQLLYSIMDEIAYDTILLKRDSGDEEDYILSCAFRFVEERPGYSVVEIEKPTSFYDNWEGKANEY